MERYEGYFITEAGGAWRTRAEAIAATDDYYEHGLWAYDTAPQWLNQ